jgi:hypothetical protein
MEESEKRNLKLLEFYRDEIKHEFSLLGHRVSWFMTGQSFLLATFAISENVNFRGLRWLSFLISIIGLVVCILVADGARAAHITIDMYLEKKRHLLQTNKEAMSPYMICRDERRVIEDRPHEESLRFSKVVPWVLFGAWFIALLFTILSQIDAWIWKSACEFGC